jgi:hypothetical protein
MGIKSKPPPKTCTGKELIFCGGIICKKLMKLSPFAKHQFLAKLIIDAPKDLKLLQLVPWKLACFFLSKFHIMWFLLLLHKFLYF